MCCVLCCAREQSVQRGSTHFYMGGDRIATLADAGSNQLYIAFTVLDSAWPGGVAKRSADGRESLAVLGEFFKGVSVAEHALAVSTGGSYPMKQAHM